MTPTMEQARRRAAEIMHGLTRADHPDFAIGHIVLEARHERWPECQNLTDDELTAYCTQIAALEESATLTAHWPDGTSASSDPTAAAMPQPTAIDALRAPDRALRNAVDAMWNAATAALAAAPTQPTPETWTDPSGQEYDLTIGYRDNIGDAWTPIGWLTPFDGVPMPYLECNGLATSIESVIEIYGPITPDSDAYATGKSDD